MPVVINEFEVVAAPEAPAREARDDTPRPAAQGMTPQDVERIVTHVRARAARTRAH
jgi:hypothetical protein